MKKQNRVFISIYFNDGLLYKRKRRDFTIAFDSADSLAAQCKHLGSNEIKRIIGIETYQELLTSAANEDRSPNNLIKHKLRIHFQDDKKNPIS
jgi:hypothetical protein